MIIFKDIFTGDELFSDAYKFKIVDDIYYQIEGKIVQEGGNEDFDIGANPSAEEEADGIEATVTTGINVVLAQRLVEISLTKDQYKKDVKGYAKRLLDKVGLTNPSRVDFLRKNLSPTVATWVSEFKNMTVYQGQSMEDGTYVLCKYPEGDCPIGTKIDVYILKDAVEEEKC